MSLFLNCSHDFLTKFILHSFLNRDASKNPAYWSKICLHNMAKLAKEATTVRRVLEPLFRNLDSGNQWSLQGIAWPVLSEMQVVMEKSGKGKSDYSMFYFVRNGL